MLLYAIDIPFFFPSFSSITTPIRSTSNTNLTFNVYILSLSVFFFFLPPIQLFVQAPSLPFPLLALFHPWRRNRQQQTFSLGGALSQRHGLPARPPPSLSFSLSVCLARSLLRTREPTPVISPSSLSTLSPSSVSVSRRANHPPVAAAASDDLHNNEFRPDSLLLLLLLRTFRHHPSSSENSRDRPPPFSTRIRRRGRGEREVEKIDEKS